MCVVVWSGVAGTAAAQIPSTFTNLQVLDSSITKPELMDRMKTMTMSLGVRCEYCHQGNPQEGFKSFDFASDEKPTKRAARVMMVMTEEINRSHLSKLAEDHDAVDAVTCFTCHHGDREPRVLKRELDAALAAGGLDSVAAAYRGLKEEFYGASVYDFTDDALSMIALAWVADGRVTEAVGLQELNAEEYPESIAVQEMFVMIYARAGQIPEAIAACKAVLAVDPENRRIQGMLKQLEEK